MDKALFIPSAIIAGILILIYAVLIYRKGLEFDQQAITNIILQSFQLVCGCVLIASTFIEDLASLVSDLNLYILIAGAVLLVNAVKTVYKDLPFTVGRRRSVQRTQTEN
ncbi:threonyl-tRNA synthetase [Alteromonas sp. a30]|uniref:threonyl-tRNA synthetase n=1 Tax=Alteromonas sp. a30 TaxID=2730917 RepID=UPI00228087C4|nr:threonyl-tRNA synthetase [Alteromonas sp. a30]MCY7297243.1 threonyl-tRNA synthetase [Alteromonas sp. a30]